MWAIIRLVVVLPFVPVTAITGTRSVNVAGRSPSGAADTRAAARATASSGEVSGRASRTPATSRARASARVRCRQGKAGRRRGACSAVGRTRTARRDVPLSAASARTSRATARAEPLAEPRSRLSGTGGAEADPLCQPDRRLVRDGRERGDVQSQLDGGPGEVEVGPFRTELDERRHALQAICPRPETAPRIRSRDQRRSGRSGTHRVESTIDMDDLAGRGWEQVRQQGTDRQRGGFMIGVVPAQRRPLAHIVSRSSNPGIALAARVFNGPAATRLTRIPCGPRSRAR